MKKKLIIPISIIFLLILISAGIIHYMNGNKKVDFKTYVFVPNHSEIITANISMKEYYKQKVIDNSLQYLDENEIILRNDLIIDTNSIIESDKCNGTTSFKSTNDAYQQIVDLECSDTDENSSSEYSSYLYDSKVKVPNELVKISDGYLMFSDINITTKTDEDGYVSQENDTNISKLDKDFNLIWSYDYIEEIKEFSDSIENEEIEETDEDIENEEIEETDEDIENEEIKESEEEDKENEDDGEELTSTYIIKTIETKEKFFFLIGFSDYNGNGKFKILILNKDGSLHKIYKFEEDEAVYSMVKSNNEIIALSDNKLYKYNYETDEINSYDLKIKEGDINILDKSDNDYLMISHTNNYFVEDEFISEGTNSLFIIDEKSQEKKSLDLDEVIGLTADESHIIYEDIKVMDNKIYISYEVMKEEEEYSVTSYPGLLIVDKELNVISNIKYANGVIKQKDSELEISKIFDYYIYNNELYVLLNIENENSILIDKFDAEGKELLKSFKRETYSNDEFENYYYTSESNILDYSEKDLVYYEIIRKEIEVGEDIDGRVIVKLAKVKL